MVARGWGGDRVPPRWEHRDQDAGDPKGPPHRPSTTLAPTDADGLFLRLMPIGPYVLIGSRCSILNQISCLFTSS
jgi:hypothetical protein